MLERTSQRFKYMDYVTPEDDCVKEIATRIVKSKGRRVEKSTIVELVFSWIKNNILPEGSSPEKDLRPCVTLRKRQGTCLAQSILTASLLRALSFSENEVWVAVTLHRGESPFEAMHAIVILQTSDKGKVIALDTTESLLEVTTLNEIIQTNTILLMFNDKFAWVPKQPLHSSQCDA